MSIVSQCDPALSNNYERKLRHEDYCRQRFSLKELCKVVSERRPVFSAPCEISLRHNISLDPDRRSESSILP
jgi:hypothetical protein